MRLSEISIERPVLATVMSLLFVVAGTISLLALSVREYPDIDRPIVSVKTLYATFESKQELYSEIREQRASGFYAAIQDAMAGDDDPLTGGRSSFNQAHRLDKELQAMPQAFLE